MKTKILICICISLLFFASSASAAVPVFPGAEGFGSTTVAGRGGQIIKVTNLNDSGPGSFRAAITANGPRIVVFEVGGTIRLKSFLYIDNPYLTIAGQTAPEPGIQIIGAGLYLRTHDILIQHLRIRTGDELPGVGLVSDRNCIALMSGAYKIMIDHNTLTWSTDENLVAWTKGSAITDVTWSNNINAEGLGSHGYGGVIGSSIMTPKIIDRFSVIKNLYTNNNERNPTVSAYCNSFVANNLAFNAQREFAVVGINGGPGVATFVGNHYITGESSLGSAVIAAIAESKVYQKDNKVSGIITPRIFANFNKNTPELTSPMIYDQSVNILPVASVRDYVLLNSGARPFYRDSVEKRIINEVMSEKGYHKDSLTHAGGWPTEYAVPKNKTFTIPANPSADSDSDGYTNIEEILHQMAAEVEGKTAAPTPTPTPVPEPVPTPQPLPVKYSLSSFTALLSNWLKSGLGLAGDINIDGKVNSKDLGIMMSNWE